jgi:hypothetical protein
LFLPLSALSTSIYRTGLATSPYLVVAYPLWGFTAFVVCQQHGSWLFCRWVTNSAVANR